MPPRKLNDAQRSVIIAHLVNGTHTPQRLAFDYGVSEDLIRSLRPAAFRQPPRPPLQLEGRVFGKWTVLRKTQRDPRFKNRGTYWLCLCACGAEGRIRGCNLTAGKSTQCKRCTGRANRSHLNKRKQ